MTHPFRRSSFVQVLFCLIFVCCLAASPLFAKTVTDFNPNLDFSKYKTFAFIGGVGNLVMLQIDPDVMNDHIHHVVNQELARRGLREVAFDQRPDLVVRYWANPPQQVNVTTMGEWAPYAPYIGSYWAWVYNDVSATSVKEGSLIIDLIDSRTKELAWRLYLIRKMANTEKDWRKTDEEFSKAFENFPPSDGEKEAKKKSALRIPQHPTRPELC